MNFIEQQAALVLKRIFKYTPGYKDEFETNSDNVEYFHQEGSNLISNGINSNQPFAVSRFGYSELRAILTYLQIRSSSSKFKKILGFVNGQSVECWWHENTVRIITHNAGVFPPSIDVIEKYVETTLQDIDQIDVLGSWLGGEKHLKDMLPNTKFMRLHDFYHFLHKEPWTKSLENKKVLVIHPFARSIERQYKKKNLIYNHPHQLPNFELTTLTAVQTIAGNNINGFTDWFEALEFMKRQISAIDFDVALLGCGAYGMSLAIHIKKLGKQAIHLGGNTQILFGIKGSRWENDPQFQSIFNNNWVKPMDQETPKGHHTIDENCYW